MSTFECPHCKKDHYIGDYPDHLTDLGPSGRFEFDCECGAVFEILVEWDPVLYVLDDTLKKPSLPDC